MKHEKNVIPSEARNLTFGFTSPNNRGIPRHLCCCRARKIDTTIIATDDMRIAEAAFAWGAEVALTSPKHQSGTDRIAEVAKRSKKFSIIVNVQGDEPLVDPRLIDRLVETLQTNRDVGIATAAHPFSDARDALSPHQVKAVIDRAGNALYFSRAPIPASRDAGGSLCFFGTKGFTAFVALLFCSSCSGNPRHWSGANHSNNCAHWRMV